VVAHTIIQNLKDMSMVGTITPKIRKSLIDQGGLSDLQVDEMITHFKANPDVDIFDSVRTMSPELNTALAVASRNAVESSFLRMGTGAQPDFSRNEIGRIMSTLLNFSIGSWEGVMVKSIKSPEKALASAKIAASGVLAYLAQLGYIHSKAIAMDSGEAKEYVRKKTESNEIFWGIYNKMPVLAATTIPLQMLSNAGVLPDYITSSPTKAGISSASIPSVSYVNNAFKASRGVVELATEDYTPNARKEKIIKDIRRVTPFLDSPLYNITLGQID
jgi:hypothetical protein